MKISYDKQADVLYIGFEPSVGKHENVENENGDVLKFDPETGRALGLVVLDFITRASGSQVIDIPGIGQTVTIVSAESLVQA